MVNRQINAVNPDDEGTKAAAMYRVMLRAGEEVTLQLRLWESGSQPAEVFGSTFSEIFELRKVEADRFYDRKIPAGLPEESRRILQQAYSGLMWTKQFYYYVVNEWNFSDVNPPVHAWACWRVYKQTGAPGHRDRLFLARTFQKLSDLVLDKLPGFRRRMEWFMEHRSERLKNITFMQRSAAADDTRPARGLRLLAIPTRERMERILKYLLDEKEFLSP